MPVPPDCHAGLGKPVSVPPVPESPELAPPLPAERLALAPQVVVLQLSFHTSSGMYERAVSATGAVDPQYLLSCPPSLNMVPPTATLKGVEASKFTDSGKVAAGEPGSSQPAAPLSPVETR